MLHPVTWEAAELDTLARAKQAIEIPGPNSNFDFEVSGPAGHFELLILASKEQLRDALRALRQVSRGLGQVTHFCLEKEQPVVLMKEMIFPFK